MKKLFFSLALWIGTAAAALAGTFNAIYSFQDFVGGAFPFQEMTLQPISYFGVNSNAFLLGTRLSYVTDDLGKVTVTNMANGRSYRVEFISRAGSVFTFTNSYNTNVFGTVYATDYTDLTTQTEGGAYAYTKEQSDARYPQMINGLLYPIKVLSSDNSLDGTNGAAITAFPQSVATNWGKQFLFLEVYPPYTNDNFKGVYREGWYTATNSYGETKPDLIWTRGYNAPGNAQGFSIGPTDPDEPVWRENIETRWQNQANKTQLEWHWFAGTPQDSNGDSDGTRWMGMDWVWDTITHQYISSDLTWRIGLIDFYNPAALTQRQGLSLTYNTTSWGALMSLYGTLTTYTNDNNNGGFLLNGGSITLRSASGGVGIGRFIPDSSTAPTALIYDANYVGVNPMGLVFRGLAYSSFQPGRGTNVPLAAKATSGQVTNLFEIQLSSGTPVSGFDSNGALFTVAQAFTDWPGPSNVVTVAYPWRELEYTAYGDISLTNISGWVTGRKNRARFQINNLSGSNINVRFPANWKRFGTILTANPHVLTNTIRLEIEASTTTNVSGTVPEN